MTQEPENFTADIQAPSGELVLIDSSVLNQLPESLPGELTRAVHEAVRIPVKNKEAVFEVSTEYDDAILRGINVAPKTDEKQEVETDEPCAGVGCDVDTIEEKINEVKLRSHEAEHDIRLRRHTPKGKDKYGHHDKDKIVNRVKNPVARVQSKASLNPAGREGSLRGGQAKAARNSVRKADKARRRTQRMTEAVEFIDKYYGQLVDRQLLESIDYLDCVYDILSNINRSSTPDINHNWIDNIQSKSGDILKEQFNIFVEDITSNEYWYRNLQND